MLTGEMEIPDLSTSSLFSELQPRKYPKEPGKRRKTQSTRGKETIDDGNSQHERCIHIQVIDNQLLYIDRLYRASFLAFVWTLKPL
jgi:hypothetical protein